MPTKKPRITITLEPHAHEVLTRLSAAGGESMSAIVTQFVDMALPSLERVVVVLERARAAPQEARAGLAAAVERAERELMPALQAALDQGDMFLAEVSAAAAPPASARASGHPQGGAPAAVPARRGGGTPVPVTRGSGSRVVGSQALSKGEKRALVGVQARAKGVKRG